MRQTRNEGGPAFPQGHMDGPHIDPSGMSLLDYFAGQALAGLIGQELSYERMLSYKQNQQVVSESQQVALGIGKDFT